MFSAQSDESKPIGANNSSAGRLADNFSPPTTPRPT